MGVETDRTSWSRQVNLDDALAGAPPPAPRICTWEESKDGKSSTRALFYPNEVHSVGGEPESMKSWLVLYAAVQEIEDGHHVVFVDMEANDRSIVHRLLLLGATPSKVKKFFHYFRPDDQITEADQKRWATLVKRLKPTLVVLDGVTEAYSMHGLSIGAAEDAATWFRQFSRRFQVKPTPEYDGAAVVELDHVVKSKDDRGGWTLGTQHKKAGIKGAMYLLESVEPFGKEKHGRSRLIVGKDSPGGIDWVLANKRRYVADFHCDATVSGGGVDAWIESAEPGASLPDGPELPLSETFDFRLLMQKVWEFIAENPGCSLRVLRGGVVGTNDKIAMAVDVLIAEGYVENKGSETRRQFITIKDFTALRVVPSGADS